MELAQAADLDAQPRAMRGVDPAHVEGSCGELVAGHGRRPRASEDEEQREQHRPPHERDGDAAGDGQLPAGVDQQDLPATDVLDGEEVGVARRARAKDARDGNGELPFERRERPLEQRMRGLLEATTSAAKRVSGRRVAASARTAISACARHASARRSGGSAVATTLLDDVARLPQPPEQDLGAREDQAQHRGVARIAHLRELLGGGPRGSSRGRGVPLVQRDLDERGPRACAGGRVVRERDGALEGLPCEVQIAELRIRDAAKRPSEGGVDATDETQSAQGVPDGKRTPGDGESLGAGGRTRHPGEHRRTRRCLSRGTRAPPVCATCAPRMLLPRLATRAYVLVVRDPPHSSRGAMCPIGLTSLAITVATTTGAGAAATAFAVRVRRAFTNDTNETHQPKTETPSGEACHEHQESHLQS